MAIKANPQINIATFYQYDLHHLKIDKIHICPSYINALSLVD